MVFEAFQGEHFWAGFALVVFNAIMPLQKIVAAKVNLASHAHEFRFCRLTSEKKLKYYVDKAGIKKVKVYPIVELCINQMASEYWTVIQAMISQVT